MKIVRLQPGPRGYGIVNDDDEIMGRGFTLEGAMKLLGGPTDPGNTPLPRAGSESGRRIPRQVHSHNEAQAPWDYMLGTNH